MKLQRHELDKVRMPGERELHTMQDASGYILRVDGELRIGWVSSHSRWDTEAHKSLYWNRFWYNPECKVYVGHVLEDWFRLHEKRGNSPCIVVRAATQIAATSILNKHVPAVEVRLHRSSVNVSSNGNECDIVSFIAEFVEPARPEWGRQDARSHFGEYIVGISPVTEDRADRWVHSVQGRQMYEVALCHDLGIANMEKLYANLDCVTYTTDNIYNIDPITHVSRQVFGASGD